MVPTLNLTFIFYGFGAIVLWVIFARTRRYQQVESTRLGDLFSQTILCFAVAVTIYSVFFALFPNDSLILWRANTLGQPINMLGFVYALGLFFYLKTNIKIKPLLHYIGPLVALIDIALHILFPFAPVINDSGILNWNTPLVIAIYYSVFALIGFFLMWLSFVKRAIKTSGINNRYFVFSIAGFFLIASGPFLVLGESQLMYIVGLSFQTLAFAGILIGVKAF